MSSQAFRRDSAHHRFRLSVWLGGDQRGGDAMVEIESMPYRVGPGSSIGAMSIINAVKCLVVENLARRAIRPDVLPSPHLVGDEHAAGEFERVLQAYHDRAQQL